MESVSFFGFRTEWLATRTNAKRKAGPERKMKEPRIDNPLPISVLLIMVMAGLRDEARGPRAMVWATRLGYCLG